MPEKQFNIFFGLNYQIYLVNHFVDFSPHVGTGEYEGKHCRLLLLVCGPMLKVCVEFTFFSLISWYISHQSDKLCSAFVFL